MKKFNSKAIAAAEAIYKNKLYSQMGTWMAVAAKRKLYKPLFKAMPGFAKKVKEIYTDYLDDPEKFREMDAAKYSQIEANFIFPPDKIDSKGNTIYGRSLFEKFFIEHLYNYHLVKQNKDLILEWVKCLDPYFCPYCNIDKTWFLEDMSRSPLDHMSPKQDFPLFSVFFYNLVPACGHCNGEKGAAPGPHLNPYLEDMDKIFKFILSDIKEGFIESLGSCWDSSKDSLFKIDIEVEQQYPDQCKAQNTINDLKLKIKYNSVKREVFTSLCDAYAAEVSVLHDIEVIFESTNVNILDHLDKEKAKHARVPLDPEEINKHRLSKIRRDLILGLIMTESYTV